MRMFVRFDAFETVVGKELIAETQANVGKAIGRIMESGKVEASGIFADGRGGIFILELESEGELIGLLGGDILDCARVETHPLITEEAIVASEMAAAVGG